MACGEAARPAQEPYKSIVAQLNQMWGTHAKVYESVTADEPARVARRMHLLQQRISAELTSRWMGITDEDQLRPILYAINAHELGHIIHGDLSRSAPTFRSSRRSSKPIASPATRYGASM